MAQAVIQTSFNAGEWAPALNARVDLAKYHSAAALVRNFFVDYRGGASTRSGTRYVLQTLKTTPARLVSYQASFTVSYILEFGEGYIRFFNNGSPVLQTAKNITGVVNGAPCILHVVAHGYSTGDWIYVDNIVGPTQLNRRYYIVGTTSANDFALDDLQGGLFDSTSFPTYISGGTTSRVHVISSPYLASELSLIKFAQNVNTLVLCHPNHPPYLLTFQNPTSWLLAPINFGATIGTPVGLAISSTLGAGTVNYSYLVTAVDSNGQESAPSTPVVLANRVDYRAVLGTNTISWSGVTGARSYNIYKAQVNYTNPVPTGSQFGFIGNCTGTSFIDSSINPDFSETPPLVQNPFQGGAVTSVSVIDGGSYDITPDVLFTAAPPGGSTATAIASMTALTITLSLGGGGYGVGDIVYFLGGISILVTGTSAGAINAFSVLSAGEYIGVLPANPVPQTSTTGSGGGCGIHIIWSVFNIYLISPGAGYLVAPTVTFSVPSAIAASTIGASTIGNPTVPGYRDQRLMLAGPVGNPQQFNLSQPGSYYNFNISDPSQSDDAITGRIVSGQLNTIKSLINMPTGMIVFTDKQAFLINGGSNGAGITPADATAQAHAYNGASDVPPIVATNDIIYIQAKGSAVRNLTYNFYTNIFTGTDISVLSSHLFYGYIMTGMAWAEEPFKTAWIVRNDGTMLTLTFLKEQELIGWAHSDTDGQFKSVACVTESVPFGAVDATYVIVQRIVNGNTLQYIERLAERTFPSGRQSAWCVDSGLQYNGPPAAVFSGMDHLIGMTITGLADGAVIPPTVIGSAGSFALATPASLVTVGLAFTPQLQTLALDLGEPTVQGKRKKIAAVTVRCQETLGLSIGGTFNTLVPMKDLALGNVGSATNEVVTDLVTGDARTIVDPSWTVPGQYCIEQPYPYPATILGVIPEVIVGDSK